MMDKQQKQPANYLYEIVENPPDELVQALRQKLRNFNISQVNINATGLGIFHHNEIGEMQAGVFGWLWGQVLKIQYLWIDTGLRGNGMGRGLLRHLEREAMARSATVAVLDTYDWQALSFYTKLGYRVFATVEGYGSGHSKYFLRRELT